MHSDSSLTTSLGALGYVHPNGQLGSKGCVARGRRTCTWMCYTAAGGERADGSYNGLSWAEREVFLGYRTTAPTTGVVSTDATARP